MLSLQVKTGLTVSYHGCLKEIDWREEEEAKEMAIETLILTGNYSRSGILHNSLFATVRWLYSTSRPINFFVAVENKKFCVVNHGREAAPV